MSTNAPRDDNHVPAALFEVDGQPGNVMPGQINQVTGRILVSGIGGGGTVNTVTGTTNRIVVDSTDPANVIINISPNYVGQSTITTLGTIVTGVWNGTAIALANGGTGSVLTDPNANAVFVWDDTLNETRLALISGLTYDSATNTLTASGLAIGNTITSATAGSVLFAGAAGILAQDNANFFWDDTNNRLGIGLTSPTARIHLRDGLAGAGQAPLKFTSGTLLTTPEAGAIEFLTDAYHGTITTGGARRTFAFLESPTFTGTVAGITATMVGLGNVTNTSDTDKPVSTAQQTALNLKANLASPTFTGTVVLPNSQALVTPVLGTPTSVTLTNATGLPISGLVNSTSLALGLGTIELGNASDTTLSRLSAGVLAVEGVAVPTISSVNTFTEKRVQPRVSSSASGDITPTKVDFDRYIRTAQSAAITISNPTMDIGEVVTVQITDNATARAITFGAHYFGLVGLPLPTTTVISKTMTMVLEKVTATKVLVSYVNEI